MSVGATDKIRLFISDLDGTLVDKKKQLTPATIAAVARLKAAGIGFTVISARPRSGVMPIVETLDLDVPIGAFNGGTIFRRDGTVLSQHRIPPAVVKGVFEMAEGLAVAPWLFADDRWFAHAEEGPHFASERVSSDQAPVVVKDFSEWYDHADKITFVSDDPPVLAGLLERAQAAYGDQATIGQSQTYYLDVTATPANKGDGIVALAVGMIVLAVATWRAGFYPRLAVWLLVADIVVSAGGSSVPAIADALHQPAPSYLLMGLLGVAVRQVARPEVVSSSAVEPATSTA